MTIVFDQNIALGPETLKSKHFYTIVLQCDITMFEINQCEVCG